MMNTLTLTCLFLFQLALVLSAPDKLVKLADLLSANTKKNMEDFIEVCSQEPMELGLVVDSSVSIEEKDFRVGQQFLSDFLSVYDIGPGRNQVRVTAVTFGRGVYVEDGFNLTTYSSKSDVLDHVAHVPFREGSSTDTGDAIAYMRDVQMRDTRPWATKFVIVVTDGNSQIWWKTKQQAEMALRSGITMFALGVGPSVGWRELLNIVGGDKERVFRAKSYDLLDDDLKDVLAKKNCVLKPKPSTTTTTTTTTPPPAIQPCSELYPSDIQFIFSPASLGMEATSWTTQFISRTVTHQDLQDGFQYGVVSGDCPDDEGFPLGRYSNAEDIRDHLTRYDRDNLPALVHSASVTGFTTASGGRHNASKIAVIFLGTGKVDSLKLNEAVRELQKSGVSVFVCHTDPGVSVDALPEGVRVLNFGSSARQSLELVSHICHEDQMLERMNTTAAAAN